MFTPAERRAEHEGLPAVLMIPFELLRVAAGNPMIVSTHVGAKVLVRIPTADEYLAMSTQALKAQGLPFGPAVSRTRAVEPTMPIQ